MHISTKCSIALHCLIFIQQYGADNRVTSTLLSLSTGCNPAAIRAILSALKKAGILSIAKGSGGAQLRLSPEDINLYQVYQAVEPDFLQKLMGIHAAPSPFCPVGRNIHAALDQSYEHLRQDLSASLQSITLKDLLKNYELELSKET